MGSKVRIVLSACFAAAILLTVFAVHATSANSGITITVNSTDHTIAMPYEKSFRFVATIRNEGGAVRLVTTSCDSEGLPSGWHLLTTTGQYELAPGQAIDYIAVFEPGFQRTGPGDVSEEGSFTAPISFSWEGGEQSFNVTARTKRLSFKEVGDGLAEVGISVLDQSTGGEVSNASVIAMLPSGMEHESADWTEEGYTLSVPSGEYLIGVAEEYAIDHTSTGYYLQVSARGYKSQFEYNYLPKDGETKVVQLEPLNEVGDYSLDNTVESGYSIWWIRASADEKRFAFSQGTHGMPGQEPPDKTKVLVTDAGGNVLWERETGGECWGLDISPDGNYVAAGCHDGKIYVWDKDGNELWKHDNSQEDDPSGEGVRVRWVRFSPDNKYLLSGPVNKRAELAGLFNAATGKVLWTCYTGDWLREGRFSSDSGTTYFSSGNGTVYAVETASGAQKWLGSGDHAIPFLLGIGEQSGVAVSTGKGRAFTALSLADGTAQWQTIVDQTVTAAQMADDGSIVGSTVGGMSYGVNSDGSLRWIRGYGGVGHNAVHYTSDGNYALLGGPNPTLFDGSGNILWQREKDKEIEMTGVAELDTGGANDVWMSDDGSLLILGGDDGAISFYEGGVEQGTNDYSQLAGPGLKITPGESGGSAGVSFPIPVWVLAVGVLGVGAVVAVVLIRRRSV